MSKLVYNTILQCDSVSVSYKKINRMENDHIFHHCLFLHKLLSLTFAIHHS